MYFVTFKTLILAVTMLETYNVDGFPQSTVNLKKMSISLTFLETDNFTQDKKRQA